MSPRGPPDRYSKQGNPAGASESRQDFGSALQLLHSLNCAAILVDMRGAILDANASMQHVLGPDLAIRRGMIEAVDQPSNTLLKELIRTAVTGGALSHQMLPAVVVKRNTRRPLIVQALPLGHATHTPIALLMMNDLEYTPPMPEARLILIFGLTRAEARLAARMAMGDNLEEASEAIGISIGTARNQIKSIFSKTHTNRQSQLVALLWRVARMAGNYSS